MVIKNMNIFISYSRKNLKEMEAIVSDVEALGHHVWFDRELSGGQNWWERILDNIRTTDLVIFILSKDSLNSTACQYEYKYAGSLKKPIIPLQINKLGLTHCRVVNNLIILSLHKNR
uniref:TIR domain-containing protein n=1 Tax=uncultured Thiotrichaceae bacterium TaxID=298394 RepID=A0A6S6UEH1_9GAMM|nr:MAG: Unknown protein [uncultured Thiotrichaceae bacterium]